MSIFNFFNSTVATGSNNVGAAAEATTTATEPRNVYIVFVGTEDIEVEGQGLTWQEVALKSGQIRSGDNYNLVLSDNGQTVAPNSPAEYGRAVRIVKVADSKGN